MSIKYGANLNTTKEREKDINAKDPPNGALAIVFQLVLADIIVEDTNSVPVACLETAC